MEIEIMFEDLIPEKQEEIAKDLGYGNAWDCINDRNWDTFPMASIYMKDDD